MNFGENMINVKQIHLKMHLYLGNQKLQSSENGIKLLLGQYYTILTVLDKLFS